MKLTIENMTAAHMKRQIDLYLSLTGGVDEWAKDWAEEVGTSVKEIVKGYELGVEVLKKFTLSYSSRFRQGTARPIFSVDVIDFVEVDSGHIATQTALRLAMFRKR